jgi:hypothetical protein
MTSSVNRASSVSGSPTGFPASALGASGAPACVSAAVGIGSIPEPYSQREFWANAGAIC